MGNAVEVLKQGLAAIGAGEIEKFAALLHPDIEVRSPGKSKLAGTHKSREEIMAVFGMIHEASGGTFKIESHSVYGDDDNVVGVYKMSAVRNGTKFEWDHVNVYQVRDGKITDVQEYIHQLYDFDQFWA